MLFLNLPISFVCTNNTGSNTGHPPRHSHQKFEYTGYITYKCTNTEYPSINSYQKPDNSGQIPTHPDTAIRKLSTVGTLGTPVSVHMCKDTYLSTVNFTHFGLTMNKFMAKRSEVMACPRFPNCMLLSLHEFINLLGALLSFQFNETQQKSLF